jgi:hypothetical protein
MHDLTTFPTTDPVGLDRVRDGMYAGDMLLTALVHLDLFTRLDRQPATKAEICRAFNIVDRPADVMLTLLAAMGLVEERKGVFHLTPLAHEHLVSSSPWFLGPSYASLKERPVCLDQIRRTFAVKIKQEKGGKGAIFLSSARRDLLRNSIGFAVMGSFAEPSQVKITLEKEGTEKH